MGKSEDAAHMEPNAWPFRHRCLRSGNCCSRPSGRVRLSPDELSSLAERLGLTPEAFRSRYCSPGPGDDLLLKDGPRAPECVFLERDGLRSRCSVYEQRPAHCRSFPHWPELREPGPALDEFLRFCPGAEPREGPASPGAESAPPGHGPKNPKS